MIFEIKKHFRISFKFVFWAGGLKGKKLYLGVECFNKDVFSALIFLFFSVFAFKHVLDRFSVWCVCVNFKNYYGSLFCYIDNLCCISFSLIIRISWPRFVFGFSRFYLNLFYNFLFACSRITLYFLLFHGCLIFISVEFRTAKKKNRSKEYVQYEKSNRFLYFPDFCVVFNFSLFLSIWPNG